LVEQVVVNDRNVEDIVWAPPGRPFFAEVGAERRWEYPQGGLRAHPPTDSVGLAYYAEAAESRGSL